MNAIALSIALAASAPAATAPPAAAAVALLPSSVVGQFFAQPGLTVIDLNPAEEYARRHVPGAIHVARPEDLATALPRDRSADVVLYCSGKECGVAEAAAREAASLGYTSLFVMEDGIEGWVRGGWPTLSGAGDQPAAKERTGS